MNNNSNSTMFSVGSYSGVPGQMCCSMLWMWPRDGSVQFICRSVQLCYPVATLRIQTALYVTVFIYVTDFCSWLSSTSGPNEDCEIVCVGVQELLLTSPAAEQACLFDSCCVFCPLPLCLTLRCFSAPPVQPQHSIENRQQSWSAKNGCRSLYSQQKEKSVHYHKSKEQCKSANSMKMAITWTM